MFWSIEKADTTIGSEGESDLMVEVTQRFFTAVHGEQFEFFRVELIGGPFGVLVQRLQLPSLAKFDILDLICKLLEKIIVIPPDLG